MAPFSNRAFTSCSITRTCWGATLVENTPINPFIYSLQDPTRYIGRSFHAVKFLLEVPDSRDWFLDLYVVEQLERHLECQDFFSAAFIKVIITVLRPVSHFESCRLSAVPMSPSFRWGSTKSHALLRCLGLLPLSGDMSMAGEEFMECSFFLFSRFLKSLDNQYNCIA